MSRMIRSYQLTTTGQPQAVDMPRRARILSVSMGASECPQLFAELVEDADTQAFGVRYVRHFLVLPTGSAVPEGAGYIGTCHLHKPLRAWHVYEVRG